MRLWLMLQRTNSPSTYCRTLWTAPQLYGPVAAPYTTASCLGVLPS